MVTTEPTGTVSMRSGESSLPTWTEIKTGESDVSTGAGAGRSADPLGGVVAAGRSSDPPVGVLATTVVDGAAVVTAAVVAVSAVVSDDWSSLPHAVTVSMGTATDTRSADRRIAM